MEPIEVEMSACLNELELNALAMQITEVFGSGAGRTALMKLLTHLNDTVGVMTVTPKEVEPIVEPESTATPSADVVPVEPTAV